MNEDRYDYEHEWERERGWLVRLLPDAAGLIGAFIVCAFNVPRRLCQVYQSWRQKTPAVDGGKSRQRQP
ncbi:MAG: hypothetical protein LBK76_08195 [Verrucomicrobiales bacterium]|jgi:hypothetical protein|nr:hypothetical protein [Verrucomicrobiales bacterium]